MDRLTVIDRVSIWIGETFCYVFLIAVVLTCYEVFMDFVFRSPTIWVHDSTVTLSSIGFLLGGAYAMQRGSHIRITSVYMLFPHKVQRVCDVIAMVLTLVYLAALGWKTGMQAWESILVGETSGRAWNVEMPIVIRSFLFLGTLLLFLQCCSEIYRLLTEPLSARRELRPPREHAV